MASKRPCGEINIYGSPPPHVHLAEPYIGDFSAVAKKAQKDWATACEHTKLRQEYSLLIEKYNFLADKYVELMMADGEGS